MKFRITATTEYDVGDEAQVLKDYGTTDVEKMLEIDKRNAIDIISWSDMSELGEANVTVEVVKDEAKA
jgi:hypothetical protein